MGREASTADIACFVFAPLWRAYTVHISTCLTVCMVHCSGCFRCEAVVVLPIAISESQPLPYPKAVGCCRFGLSIVMRQFLLLFILHGGCYIKCGVCHRDC